MKSVSGRTRGAVAAAMLGWAAPALAAPAARDPSGVWLTEDGRARVQVDRCGPAQEQICGYIVWLKTGVTDDGQPRLDSRNPNPAKAGRPLLGHQLIMGLKPNDEGRFEGSIYNSEDGKSYDVTVWLDKPTTLKVKGCLVAFLCSTQNWTKTSDVSPGQLVGAVGGPGGARPDPEWASVVPVTTGQPPVRREAKPRS